MAALSEGSYARGFAADSGTERALRAGLAGRDARIQRGRFADALKALAAEPASRLVFVDFDGVSDPEPAAARLAEVCAFETAVVAVGSVDTARFSRALLRRGIADYLVKPVSAAMVREASAAAAAETAERPYAGRVVAFAGSPGSGTSTLVAAVARGVAADGRSASVVDLDPVGGKVAALLDVEAEDGLPGLLAAPGADASSDPEPAAPAALAVPAVDPAGIDGISVAAAPGISLIGYPAAGPLPERAPVPTLWALLEHLANRTHVVLATGLTEPETQIEVMRRADARVLVYEPSLPSVSVVVRRLAWLGADAPSTLVQCSTRMRRYPMSPAHIRYALADRRPDLVIPFERALHAGATGNAPGRPGKPYRKALRRATELLGHGWSPLT